MSIPRHVLSKSTYMYGCQCLKRLYLHKFQPALRNPMDEAQQSIFDSGTNIGLLAQQLFPNGIDASPEEAYLYQQSVAKTQKLMAQNYYTIYEAAFQYDGVMCAIDILVKKNNKWYAFEVKGSNSVKEQFIADAALQYLVITNAGIELEDISIIHLNRDYVRKGDLDIQQLFTCESILQEVKAQQNDVTAKVDELKKMLAAKKEPAIPIGEHCFTPYECDFSNHCWKNTPQENSVFDLAYGKPWDLIKQGIFSLDEITDDIELGSRPAMQLKHHRSKEIFVDEAEMKSFKTNFSYPLYFLDFETMMAGVPPFDNTSPYQQIPFQFSLHVQMKKDAPLQHIEFLGDGIIDPREPMIIAMLDAIGKKGNVVCYNASFERSCIEKLADSFPKYKKELLKINERIIDLMRPFQARWYYHPDFKGSYSIKYVLPVLVKELSYQTLEIQEGGTASLTYTQLKSMSKEEQLIVRKNLLDYCCMDTLAMVKIWHWLENNY